MKILVINGSPKGERSDTMHMTRAFLEGMRGVAEHEVEHVDIMKQHIEFCRACFSCKKNVGECIHNDDMAGLLQKYPRSRCEYRMHQFEGVLIAPDGPLYPSQLGYILANSSKLG